jgi:hypothetical protein
MCCTFLDHDPELRKMPDFGRQTHMAYRDFARLYTVFTSLSKVVSRNLERAFGRKALGPRRFAMVYDVDVRNNL